MSEHQEERLGSAEGTQKRGPGRPPRVHAPLPGERYATERERDERELTEDRDLTDDERLEFFLDSMHQSILPDLPRFPGYHVFWATTTNPRDSIQWRQQLGYRLIRSEECPGYEGISHKAGDYAGVIGVNEMVAMRIPLRLYNAYMKAMHHSLPLKEEEKIRASQESMRENARRVGSKIEEGDGTGAPVGQIVQRADPMPELNA